MQVAQSNGNLRNHESGLLFGEPSDFDQVSEQLATLDELHDEKDSLSVLEDIVHAYDEGVFDVVQDFLFKLK